MNNNLRKNKIIFFLKKYLLNIKIEFKNWFNKYFFKKKENINILNKKQIFTFRGALDKRPNEIKNKIKRQYLKKINQEKDLNVLLDKIKENGYNSLTEKEKEKLIKISENY